MTEELAVMIPIIGIIFIFGGPVAIVWLALRAHIKKKELMHHTIELLAEKDQQVPLELIGAFEKNKPINMLYVGVILVAAAIGLVTFLLLKTNVKIASVAAIPFCIGVAFLILWAIDKKTKQSEGE